MIYVAFLGQQIQIQYQQLELKQSHFELKCTRDEIRGQREELKGQKEEMEKQNRAIAIQLFENTFFISSRLACLKSVVLYYDYPCLFF